MSATKAEEGGTNEQSGWLRALEFASEKWVVILAVSTATGFLSGLAYYKGYFGAFGFESLAFSLPFEMYLVVGALSIAAVVLPQILVGVPIAYAAARRQASEPRRLERALRRFDDLPAPVVLMGSVAILVVPLYYTWHWLVPAEAVLPFAIHPLAVAIILILGLLVFLPASLVVLRNLKGPTLAAVGLAFLFVWAPAVAKTVGESRADAVFDNLDGQTRVLVWRDANSTAPEGYVVIHQDADLLYLVARLEVKDGVPIFRATIMNPNDLHRIDFVPPGVSVERFRPDA